MRMKKKRIRDVWNRKRGRRRKDEEESLCCPSTSSRGKKKMDSPLDLVFFLLSQRKKLSLDSPLFFSLGLSLSSLSLLSLSFSRSRTRSHVPRPLQTSQPKRALCAGGKRSGRERADGRSGRAGERERWSSTMSRPEQQRRRRPRPHLLLFPAASRSAPTLRRPWPGLPRRLCDEG